MGLDVMIITSLSIQGADSKSLLSRGFLNFKMTENSRHRSRVSETFRNLEIRLRYLSLCITVYIMLYALRRNYSFKS